MAAASTATTWKLDDDPSFAVNCFPARGIARRTNEGLGSWVVSYAVEQHRRFNSLAPLSDSPTPAQQVPTLLSVQPSTQSTAPVCLDKKFLLSHHHVDSPSDLCSANIADCNLEFVIPGTLKDFTNVAYVNASENLLTLQTFKHFVNLRELEISLNGLRNIAVHAVDFPCLQVLDMSYNNLSPHDMAELGVITNLKVLTLTGNGLNSIHPLVSQKFQDENTKAMLPRFQKLEILNLDDNRLHDMATFASLATLPSLQILNLDKNNLELIPYLKVLEDTVISETHTDRIRSAKSASGKNEDEDIEKSSPRSRGSNRKSKKKVTRSISNASVVRDPINGSIPPPFQNLVSLSLANNKISKSEHVISVAGWPQLRNLVLTGNPIVKHTKGEPPIISHYLNKRLGINIVRFKPKAPVVKPVMTNRSYKRIRTNVPKFLKQPVDSMLEEYRTLAIENSQLSQESAKTLHFKSQEPSQNDVTKDGDSSDNVFLTQVHDERNEVATDPTPETDQTEESSYESSNLHALDDLNGVKVAELLSDVKPDKDLHEDLSIQGNIRMLHTLLTHPSKFHNTDLSPDVRRKKRVPKFVYTASSNKTKERDIRSNAVPNVRQMKQENLNKALEQLKKRDGAVKEIPLNYALEDEDRELREVAAAHFEKIEEKYRVVREASLKASRDRKRAISAAKEGIDAAQRTLIDL